MTDTPTAVKQQPISPPRSIDGDFDLSAVQQHIAALDQQVLPPPVKPTTQSEELNVSRWPVRADPSSTNWRQQDPYGDPSDYQTAANPMYYPSQPVRGEMALDMKSVTDLIYQGFHRANQPATPPVTGYDEVMRTRSGRSLGSPLTIAKPATSRRSRSPKPKAKRPPRNAKASAQPTPELAEPLSVLTKDWTVPLGDTGAKVHRSAEQRREEVYNRKHHGKVPRPMNSFMLYRSAYADRVKEYCKETNHQMISQITGASWAKEPREIKELYEKYADIDRQNHQQAHPDYKFAPNKNGPASRKRKGREDDDDQTDWEDRDYEASSTSTKRRRQGQSIESRSRSSTPFEPPRPYRYGAVPANHYANPSAYHVSNPRSVPPVYPANVDDHYYEQWATPYNNNIEDVHVRRMPHPNAIPYDPLLDGQSLVGLPQGPHPSHLQPHSGYGMMQPAHMNAVDPRLEQYGMHDPYSQYDLVGSMPPLGSGYDYGQDDILAAPQYAYPEPSAHPGMATLTSPRMAWDPRLPGADFDEALEEWA